MPHGETVVRDPDTGRFQSIDQDDFELEYVVFEVNLNVPAADVSGATDAYYAEQGSFEGVQLYDLDDILDRHSVAQLLFAQHALVLQPTGTQTADSAAYAVMEISASPSAQIAFGSTASNFNDIQDTGGDFAVQQLTGGVESFDLLGRPLIAMAQGPFTDGTNQLGGGGGPGSDRVQFEPLGFDMDRRDEMFLNGAIEVQNLADGPATAAVAGQHIYAVEDT